MIQAIFRQWWSFYGQKLPWKVYVHKGYYDEASQQVYSMNRINGAIMQKDQVNAKMTKREDQSNKCLVNRPYKIEQQFGLIALHHPAGETSITGLAKDGWARHWGR
jgi:hypothetical protein